LNDFEELSKKKMKLLSKSSPSSGGSESSLSLSSAPYLTPFPSPPRWKRRIYLSELAKATTSLEAEQEEDGDDVMILRSVPKPSLEECRGYWVEVDEDRLTGSESGDFIREGLIEGVDLATKILIVDFGTKDSPEEYEVQYDSEHIKQWFLMTSRREQDRIVSAALRIQLWAKRKLHLKPEHYLHTLSAINSAQSIYLSRSASFSAPTTLARDDPQPQSQPQSHEPSVPSPSTRHPQLELEKRKETTFRVDPSPALQEIGGAGAGGGSEEEKEQEGQEQPEMEGGVKSPVAVRAMILRPVLRPLLEKAVGYWIAQASDPEREALVNQIDFQNRLLRAEFLDTDEESAVVVSYDDPSLTWYRMSSKKEEESEVNAAIRIQTIVRGRSPSPLPSFPPPFLLTLHHRLARAKVKMIMMPRVEEKDRHAIENFAAEKIQKILRRFPSPLPSCAASTSPSTGLLE
jgi:hypothetical protein